MKQAIFFTFLALVAAACLCGCAERKVHFDSNPAGATVSYDSRHCITPCTLPANCDAGKALLSHPIAGEAIAEVKACALGDSIRYHSLHATEETFKVAAAPFALLGVIGLGAMGEQTDNGDSVHPDLLLFTAGSLLSAGILYGVGELFGYMKGDLDGEVWVTFPTHNNPPRPVPPAGVAVSNPAPPEARHITPAQSTPASLQLDTEAYRRLFAEPQPDQQP